MTNLSGAWQFFFFCVPQLHLWGSPLLVRFLPMWPFLNPTIAVVPFRLHGWCMLGEFLLLAFHLSRTWMSGSFESVRWNYVCVHRLDLSLYSHPQEFLRNGVRTHVNCKGKIPSVRKISPEKRMELTTLHQAGQGASTLPTSYSFRPQVPVSK